MNAKRGTKFYYVDEAGDSTLFTRRGRPIVGTTGCSTYFMLGLIDVATPDALADDLADLRNELLNDPYFRRVPSVKPDKGKTAVKFHAKDDIPEVRREVFRLLMRHGIRFYAVIRDKRSILETVARRNIEDPGYRYSPLDLYDYLVRCLFRDRLHKDDHYLITFSRSGRRDRISALRDALYGARENFHRKWGITADAPIDVVADVPTRVAGLQAVDYFLWALQRAYERGEARYVEYIWSAVGLIRDIDHTAEKPYGEYYTQKNPLDVTKIKPGI